MSASHRPRTRNASSLSRAYALPVTLLVLIAVVALIVYVRNERLARAQYAETAHNSLIARSIQPDDHLLAGSPSSPVTLIVYSDLSCQYCKQFFVSTLPKLRAEYGDSFIAVYRHLPLKTYPQSFPEAVASECVAREAGEPAFRSYAKNIFSDPHYEDGLSTSTLQAMAADLGVSPASFASCMSDPSIALKVQTDAQEAAVAGLSIAPSFVVKSADRAITVQGDSLSGLRAAISYLLASATAQ